MFHSMEVLKAIHDDRLREIERAVRDRRLLHPDPDEAVSPVIVRTTATPALRAAGSAVRSGSACEPAQRGPPPPPFAALPRAGTSRRRAPSRPTTHAARAALP